VLMKHSDRQTDRQTDRLIALRLYHSHGRRIYHSGDCGVMK